MGEGVPLAWRVRDEFERVLVQLRQSVVARGLDPPGREAVEAYLRIALLSLEAALAELERASDVS